MELSLCSLPKRTKNILLIGENSANWKKFLQQGKNSKKYFCEAHHVKFRCLQFHYGCMILGTCFVLLTKGSTILFWPFKTLTCQSNSILTSKYKHTLTSKLWWTKNSKNLLPFLNSTDDLILKTVLQICDQQKNKKN